MNKKLIAGAMIALAAGIATFIYKKNRNKINDVAADAYNKTNDVINHLGEKAENLYS